MENKDEYDWLLDTDVDNVTKKTEQAVFSMTEEGWLDIPRDITGVSEETEGLKCIYTSAEIKRIAEEMQPYGDNYVSMFKFSDCVIHDLTYGLVTLTF